MLTLIANGDVWAPEHRGRTSILCAGRRIARVGEVDPAVLRALDDECEVVDVTGCLVLPGLIDPHEHLIGAGGEEGFGSREPEVRAEDILGAGITTVVGCLGTDTVTRQLAGLLAKARELDASGVTSYIYTGGFPVPPPTLTGSVTKDLVLIDPIIGVGEIAIADYRSTEPTVQDLAKLASDAILGGLLGGKAGVTHFHVGEGERRLALLRELLEAHDIPPKYLYPTHVARTSPLMDEAIQLSQRGAFVDLDCVEGGIARWLRYFRDHGGARGQFTISSDSQTPGGRPDKLHAALAESIAESGLPLADVISHFTANAARALQLASKGCLGKGFDADVLVLDPTSLAVVHVFGRGRHLVAGGKPRAD